MDLVHRIKPERGSLKPSSESMAKMTFRTRGFGIWNSVDQVQLFYTTVITLRVQAESCLFTVYAFMLQHGQHLEHPLTKTDVAELLGSTALLKSQDPEASELSDCTT